MASIAQQDDTIVYNEILHYDWDGDLEFQEGLQSILSSLPPDTKQSPELIDRARCFFWGKRTDRPISYDDFVRFKDAVNAGGAQVGQSSTAQPAPTYTDADEKKAAPYPQSFADIVELISSGKPIPGIREIPNKINEAPPTEPVKEKRRKPWEINRDASESTS